MIQITWEWIGIYTPAFDLANTVVLTNGSEHDLLAPDGEYERWADLAAASTALDRDARRALLEGRAQVLELRDHIRAVFRATAARGRPPKPSVAALNEASRLAPQWTELSQKGEVRRGTEGEALERLLASYARSAIEVAAAGAERIRICGAPSCGMFYPPGRRDQRWCSEPCGTRARVARHYQAHRGERSRR